MTTIINADNGVISGVSGLKYSADNSGILVIQTNGTTALTINADQTATFASAVNFASASFVAPVIVQGSTTDAALRITQTGTGNALLVEDAANPDSSPFVIDNAGNVGIGTNSPVSPLTVTSNAGATGITIKNRTGNDYASLYFTTNDGTTLQTGIVNALVGTNGAAMLFNKKPDGSASTEAMRIDTAGNVGIGVVPSAWVSTYKVLQLSTTGSFASAPTSAYLSNNWYQDGSSVNRYLLTGSLGIAGWEGNQFKWYTAPSGTAGASASLFQAMVLDGSTGNLGIGTSSPSTKLAVVTSTSNAGIVVNDGTVNTILYNTGGANGSLGTTTNHPFAFYTNNSEKMRIGTNGAVNIGGTTTGGYSEKLMVQSGGSTQASIMLLNPGIGSGQIGFTASSPNFSFKNTYADGLLANGVGFEVDTSGNLLVGTNNAATVTYGNPKITSGSNARCVMTDVGVYEGQAAATVLQYVALWKNPNGTVGSIYTNGTTTTYATSSDYRLKEITGRITGYKERIAALQPKEGTWKVDGAEFKGFLAHEFANQYPNLVSGKKDGVDKNGNPVYQGMQASGPEVIADLVAMVQELNAKVEMLEAQLAAK